jgi:hypothetical protein
MFLPGIRPALNDSQMLILRVLPFLFLTHVVFAQQPTPILPDPKLTPGDTFDVTAQDVCVPGYAKKVRGVPVWLKESGVRWGWNQGAQIQQLRLEVYQSPKPLMEEDWR